MLLAEMGNSLEEIRGKKTKKRVQCTDWLGCQDVNEAGGKQDEEDGQTDPGQVL